MEATVSLIIPAYNCAGTLARAVHSGLRQGFLQEIIIVDDCSIDSTRELAETLASTLDRVRVLQTGANVGPGAARNLGARNSTGTYLSFLDADDELQGDFFTEALALLQSMPEMRVVKSDQEFFDPVKGYILPNFDARYGAAVLSSSVGMVLHRDVFMTIGGFPESEVFRGPCGGEDVFFMKALIEQFQPIGRIQRPAYKVWSKRGSHVDRFLTNTRLTQDNTFEFVWLHPDQQPGSALHEAMKDRSSTSRTLPLPPP